MPSQEFRHAESHPTSSRLARLWPHARLQAGVSVADCLDTAIRRGHYLRSYAYRLIELCSTQLTENIVRAASAPPKNALDHDDCFDSK
jgi:hypothetical protein